MAGGVYLVAFAAIFLKPERAYRIHEAPVVTVLPHSKQHRDNPLHPGSDEFVVNPTNPLNGDSQAT